MIYLLPVSFHPFVSERCVQLDDVIRRALRQDWCGLALGILYVFLDEGDGEDLLRVLLTRFCLASGVAPSDRVGDTDVEQRIELFEWTRVYCVRVLRRCVGSVHRQRL
jgi:hypothetical protein